MLRIQPNVRIRIRIILFWIYKYGTISVTIIYINKHDSRLILGTDIKTFVEAHRLPLGYQANRY